MKSKFHLYDALVIACIIVPCLYLASVYASLPATVATHFGIDGKPDQTGDKSTLWFVVCLLGGVSIFSYLLIRFLPKIDPKKTAQYSTTTYNKIAIAVAVLVSGICCLIIRAAQVGSFEMGNMLPVLLGVFFAVMGNLMHNIKPNYFVGIRTPWTLESEETWRKTHQLAGKIWFFGGLLLAAISFFLPAEYAFYVLMVTVAIMALIPVGYSYIYFKQLQKTNHPQ
jgi:uncharacterized membrane protein